MIVVGWLLLLLLLFLSCGSREDGSVVDLDLVMASSIDGGPSLSDDGIVCFKRR